MIAWDRIQESGYKQNMWTNIANVSVAGKLFHIINWQTRTLSGKPSGRWLWPWSGIDYLFGMQCYRRIRSKIANCGRYGSLCVQRVAKVPRVARIWHWHNWIKSSQFTAVGSDKVTRDCTVMSKAATHLANVRQSCHCLQSAYCLSVVRHYTAEWR